MKNQSQQPNSPSKTRNASLFYKERGLKRSTLTFSTDVTARTSALNQDGLKLHSGEILEALLDIVENDQELRERLAQNLQQKVADKTFYKRGRPSKG